VPLLNFIRISNNCITRTDDRQDESKVTESKGKQKDMRDEEKDMSDGEQKAERVYDEAAKEITKSATTKDKKKDEIFKEETVVEKQVSCCKNNHQNFHLKLILLTWII
jgi:hypothetical protein